MRESLKPSSAWELLLFPSYRVGNSLSSNSPEDPPNDLPDASRGTVACYYHRPRRLQRLLGISSSPSAPSEPERLAGKDIGGWASRPCLGESASGSWPGRDSVLLALKVSPPTPPASYRRSHLRPPLHAACQGSATTWPPSSPFPKPGISADPLLQIRTPNQGWQEREVPKGRSRVRWGEGRAPVSLQNEGLKQTLSRRAASISIPALAVCHTGQSTQSRGLGFPIGKVER